MGPPNDFALPRTLPRPAGQFNPAAGPLAAEAARHRVSAGRSPRKSAAFGLRQERSPVQRHAAVISPSKPCEGTDAWASAAQAKLLLHPRRFLTLRQSPPSPRQDMRFRKSPQFGSAQIRVANSPPAHVPSYFEAHKPIFHRR